MKTSEEFRNKVYEKHGVQLAVRKRRRHQAMVCVPLAFLIVLSSVFLPRLLTGGTLPVARTGKIPLMLQVGNPAPPTDLRQLSIGTSAEERLDIMLSALSESDHELAEELTKEREALEEQLSRQKEASLEEVREMQQAEQEMLQRMTELTKGEISIDPAFSDSVNQFARDSAVWLSKDFGENGCYSPLSMYYALALTSCGAGGKTKEEFQNVLYAKDDWAAEQCGRFYRQHYHKGEDGTFRLENSLWLDGNYSFGDKFISYAEDDFYSSLFQVDFSDPELSGEMTKWISDRTDGLLSPAFTFEDHQMLYILNTVLFASEWVDHFTPANNTRDTFTKADGSTVTAEFMNRDYEPLRYNRGNGFVSASLPLKSGDQMVFVLPDPGVSTGELLSDPDLFEEMFFSSWEKQKHADVRWSIPKFSFDCEYDLQNTLKSMGLNRAFDEVAADFSDMGKLAMYLSQTTQGVHIDVNEDGVTAAAYTAIGAVAGSGVTVKERIDMVLDRPFLFAIVSRDETTADEYSETLLFVGACGDPTASGAGSAAAAG